MASRPGRRPRLAPAPPCPRDQTSAFSGAQRRRLATPTVERVRALPVRPSAFHQPHHSAASDEGLLPRVHDGRLRLPEPCVGRAGKNGDRPVLRGHRDPVVRLREHRRLARDRVAQHREALSGSDQEGVEAVQVGERPFERLLERRALAHAPRQVAGRHLGVVFGLKINPFAAQPLTEPVVIGERTVVDQAEVEPGGEWVRPFGRDTAFGRHPRVPETVAPLDVAEPELLHERLWATDLLVDLDHPARAHDAQVGAMTPDPVLDVGRIAFHQENSVIRANSGFVRATERRGQLGAEATPGHLRVERVESELARAARGRIPIDGDARAVGPAVAHLLEHRGEVLPEPRLEFWRLAEESDYSTHMVSFYTRSTTLGLSVGVRCPLFHTAVWSLPPYT